MAEFIKLYEKGTDMRKIEQIVACLKNGGVIIYPTDTVYGMGCDIHNTRAVERICQIKGIKPNKNNFSFICHDLSNIADYAKVSTAACGDPEIQMVSHAVPTAASFAILAEPPSMKSEIAVGCGALTLRLKE